MRISAKSNIKQFMKDLDRTAKKQMPYATSKAINAVAKAAEKEINKQIGTLDNPTPLTKKSTFVKPSHKRQNPIEAIVGVKDIQAEYMQYPEYGGVSKPKKGGAKPVPSTAHKNKYGNLPRGKIKRLLAKKDKYFSGKPKGHTLPSGVYKRLGRKGRANIQMVAVWKEETKHTPQIRIGERVRLRVERDFSKILRREFRKAMDSAK